MILISNIITSFHVVILKVFVGVGVCFVVKTIIKNVYGIHLAWILPLSLILLVARYCYLIIILLWSADLNLEFFQYIVQVSYYQLITDPQNKVVVVFFSFGCFCVNLYQDIRNLLKSWESIKLWSYQALKYIGLSFCSHRIYFLMGQIEMHMIIRET